MCDSDLPKAFSKIERKARKEHKCCECGSAIKAGEKYQFCSGIWDRPESYKTCLDCASIREDYMALHETSIVFTELRDSVFGSYDLKERIEHYPEDANKFIKLYGTQSLGDRHA